MDRGNQGAFSKLVRIKRPSILFHVTERHYIVNQVLSEIFLPETKAIRDFYTNL